jgi:hypothetical protein
MATKAENTEILNRHKEQLKKLAPEAAKAFGSRATDSPAHDISREFTNLLVAYVKDKGSLLMLSKELNITYPALMRRVKTATISPLPRKAHSTAAVEEYTRAASSLNILKKGPTATYHDAIRDEYDKGLSLNKLAKYMGLRAAYPLYYGLNNSRLRSEG